VSESEGQACIADRRLQVRPETKLLDCTIRDGGLMNSHRFDDKTVRAVYRACVEAGIDYMEIGYKNSRRLFAPDKFGAWKYCSEDDVRRVVEDGERRIKLSAMADAEKSDYRTDIVPKQHSPLDMIRVATYVHQLPVALDMVKDAHDKGYETTLNLMAVSKVSERELDEALERIAGSEVDVVYVVDSFGALYSQQIRFLVKKYVSRFCPLGKRVGIHAHNNQQLAFANTIEGLIGGAAMLDASLGGLGRGAGNCQMELLVAFLRSPRYQLRPLLHCIQHYIEPMRQELRWGYDVPYMITGVLNQHPRAGMEFNASDDRGDYVKFFDLMQQKR